MTATPRELDGDGARQSLAVASALLNHSWAASAASLPLGDATASAIVGTLSRLAVNGVLYVRISSLLHHSE